MEKQTKLALTPFDDKRMYLNPIKSLPWDIHIQPKCCSCILCIKFTHLCYKELSENKSDEEFQINVSYHKKKSHQEILKLVSDRAGLL